MLKTAFGIVKTGLHDFGDGYWYAENHHQRAGSSFSFLSLFPFYFSKLSFYFYTFLLFNQRVPIGWYIPVNKPGNTGGVLGGMVTKTHGMDAARANPHFLGLGLSGIELVEPEASTKQRT